MKSFQNPLSFKKNGFVLVKNVIPIDKVAHLRKKLMAEVPNGFQGAKGIDAVLDNPDFFQYQFSNKIIGIFNSIFGEQAFYINDFNLQFNNGDNRGKFKGWHIDANSELARFVPYLFSKNYQLCKVGLYLQDNTFEFGGGIDVEVGGHKSFRDLNNRFLNLVAYKLDRIILSRFRKKLHVPIEAGDAVIFDSRLPHASSCIRVKRNEIPQKNRKLNLYWDVAGNEVDAMKFYENSVIRAINSIGDESAFFSNYLRYSFPESYPQQYIKYVQANSSIKIFCLDKVRSQYFQETYKKVEHWIEDNTGFDTN